MGGNYPHLNMHLHGGVPNGGRVEFHWQGWKCVEATFDNAPGPVNGYVTLPTGPGLGFTPKAGVSEKNAAPTVSAPRALAWPKIVPLRVSN